MNLRSRHCVRTLHLLLFFLAALRLHAGAAAPDSAQFPGLRWRLIGPFRAGRVTAVAGVTGDPSTFYFGTPGGGVWKTTDAGRVWRPIFDKERIPSIGAVAVAPSNSRVIYVGTGEQTKGRGMYRSSDGGETWKSIGLEDVPFIQAIVLDPRNPDVVIVGANSLGMGIVWSPIPEWAKTVNRGIFKSTDGGKTWKKVYASDANMGIFDMCSDLSNPRTLYAATYTAPSGSGKSKIAGTSEILRSTDEGSTWTPLKSKGLPEKDRKRMGVMVAPGTGGRRLYAIMDQGLFRSDDAGATWRQSTKDPRVIGNEYFSRVFVDPNHPDIVYVAQTSLYRSTDGGITFAAYVGAPSGDDFHVLWIDPKDSARMILGVDQGAIISVDGGRTWTSWYNQPTGQFYHISTDNVFPYRVYAAQQDSGTAGVLSRSDYGEILLQDWYSVAGFEYSFITPDPVHHNLVYSNGWYGTVVRLDTNSGQYGTVFERGQKYRAGQMPPLVFSPQDPSVLYLGMQFVLKTRDGGSTWPEISPDLTGYVEKEDVEEDEDVGAPKPPAISSLAPSPLAAGEIWAGTSNRLVYLMREPGGPWDNVTPPGLGSPTETLPLQVLYVEASHFDPATAYLTLGALRESTPADVLRTHDFGRTWQKIVNGFPENEMVRVVREDPKRKGLLYAGTDTGIFISWDDGDHWQPFSLNLPASPVTDLTVHGNDLAISTYGRGLWILDDVTPVREFKPEVASADFYFFPPATTLRARWQDYQDTPYPIETPAGENPPDGAILNYFLKGPPHGDLTLTIYDEKNAEVASFSSEQKPEHHLPANVPDYWFAPPATLPKTPGVNRFAWDLRYPSPATLPYSYYGQPLEYTEYTFADHAVPGQTPRPQPRGPIAAPGNYTAVLRYGGQELRQPLTIEIDPRVPASASDLREQSDLALALSRGMKSSHDSFLQVTVLSKALAERQKSLQSEGATVKEAAEALEKKIAALEKGSKLAPGFGPLNRDMARLIYSIETADMRPTEPVRTAVQENCTLLDKDLVDWRQLNAKDIPVMNAMLAEANLSALPVAPATDKGCEE